MITASDVGKVFNAARPNEFIALARFLNLIKGLTALENVMIPAYPTGEKHSLLKERALASLALFNLAHRADAQIEWLSGGEAQRVAIARALINDPDFIIADEPTAHLDTRLSAEFMAIMHRLKEQGKTIILASHDPLVYDSDLAEQVIEMCDGRVLPAGEHS